MAKKLKLKIGKTERTYGIVEDPVPHILVDSKKQLHGWWPGKRECSSERMLINPYNGCSIDCFCCYAKALPGYFQTFREKKVITVFQDFHQVVAEQLDSVSVASTGYLSPVTDPFQPLNDKYRLSESIIELFVERNLPIEFITKQKVSQEVIELLSRQSHCFGQFSVLTLDENLRRHLMDGGATTEELFESMERLASAGIHTVCRVDPIIPHLTDEPKKLEEIIRQAVNRGANHIVTSVMDISLAIADDIFKRLTDFGHGLVYDLRRLYTERIDNALHAKIGYRKRLFDRLRNICERLGVSFALCMEYELMDGQPVGLNREFMSSANCEGIDIPIYVRRGDRFEPVTDCNGACLTCKQAQCGIEDLAMGRQEGWEKPGFKLADYRRWSRELAQSGQGELFKPDKKSMGMEPEGETECF